MSGIQPSPGPTRPLDASPYASAAEVPTEYGETYRRAYRRSLAEHPTEVMSAARPGKRATQPSASAGQRAKIAGTIADLLSDTPGRLVAGAGGIVLLLLVAYGVGRLLS